VYIAVCVPISLSVCLSACVVKWQRIQDACKAHFVSNVPKCISFCISLSLCVCFFALSVCLSVCLCICLCLHLSVCVSVCQFVELKGSVFKKFEKHNLFQMSCSDVRERFHLLFLLTVVGVRNLTDFSWNMGQDTTTHATTHAAVAVAATAAAATRFQHCRTVEHGSAKK